MKGWLFNRFYLSKSDRLAFVFLLFVLIGIGVARWYFYDYAVKDEDTPLPAEILAEHEDFQEKARAAEAKRAARHRGETRIAVPETFPFDPNTADSSALWRLGLSNWQISNLLKYRRKGGVWRSPEHFSRLYGLSAEEFQRLRPFLRIAAARPAARERELPATQQRRAFPEKLSEGSTVELNDADTTLLKQIPGIGSYYAAKICRYRERLGGFVSVAQIKEVEGLPADIERWFTLASPGNVRKVNVNRADFKQLVRHPYLSYEQVKVIVEHIRKYGPLQGWDDLRLYPEFEEQDFQRLSPYFLF